VRRDIADIALADRLFAPHYARAQPLHCRGAATMVRAAALHDAPAVSQLLPGESFCVLDIGGDWSWGYCAADGYVGYVRSAALAPPGVDATHLVTAATALIFTAPDIKAPLAGTFPVGSRIAGRIAGEFLALDAGGYVHHRHCTAVDDHADDPVTVACALVGMPYLWGGRGAGGIDCSGLVQLALARCGRSVPRDSDQQRAAVGTALADDTPATRGDLVFFPGHVGLMVDAERLVHANAYWMAVTIDPLADVVARIATTHETPILARRRLP
jgi:cell wall-associated NlpC family hydrolase